jgi:uncharacterized protein (TIGR02246 family)
MNRATVSPGRREQAILFSGASMNGDEQAIRAAVQTWMQASADGDLPRVLALIDEDVVFLGPGRPPMRKAEFEAASKAMAGKMRIDGASDIQDIRVVGDWAYVWTQLTITMSPGDGSGPVRRSGPGLSVWRKTPDGRWVIYRDANMVTTEEPTGEKPKSG